MPYTSNFWLRHQAFPNNNTRKNNGVRKNTQPLVLSSTNMPRSNSINNNKMVFKPISSRPKKYRTRKNSRVNRR